MKTIRLLFNDDMARAIVEGRKTVTRRPVLMKDGSLPPSGVWSARIDHDGEAVLSDGVEWHFPPPCAPGDIFIGRECWQVWDGRDDVRPRQPMGDARVTVLKTGEKRAEEVVYRADRPSMTERWLWRPSIHMPDWAARIRRRVVSVTVERLQDISEADAVREGFGPSEELEELFRNCAPPGSRMQTARERCADTWDRIYAPKNLGWAANSWVWRIEFSAENVQETSNAR